MNKALLIIDYSYDFVATDGKLTAGEAAQHIEKSLYERIKQSYNDGEFIFFMMDTHVEEDCYHPETKLFPAHNILGSKGIELYQSIRDLYNEIKDDELVFFIEKTRYSAFQGTPLQLLLKERNIESIQLTGLVTDICILHTAIDAYNLGYDITIYKDCVASFNQVGHEFSLSHFEKTLGAIVE